MSLLAMAVLVWLVWEICVIKYPERFLEETNDALHCDSCKDKLCPYPIRRQRALEEAKRTGSVPPEES
jgi:hypothetical protein